MSAQIATAALAGFVFGVLQSLLLGTTLARNWQGGTGCVWGIIIAVPSTIASIWTGWYASLIALALSVAVFLCGTASIARDKKRVDNQRH